MLWAETADLYQRFLADVELHGTLVQGRGGVLVKNPSLAGLSGARDALVRIGRAIPLSTGQSGGLATVDEMIAEAMAAGRKR